MMSMNLVNYFTKASFKRNQIGICTKNQFGVSQTQCKYLHGTVIITIIMEVERIFGQATELIEQYQCIDALIAKKFFALRVRKISTQLILETKRKEGGSNAN